MNDDHIGVKINGIIYVKLDDVKPMRDRIEKLEAANLQQSLIKLDDMRRIEKLEAALRDFATCDCSSNCDAKDGRVCELWACREALDAK